MEVQSSSSPSDAESFAALARLSPAEYDRARRAEAKRLDLRIETLDTEVAKCRAELNLEAQANAVQLPAIEPWPEPVYGAEALDQASSRYSLYLVLPPGAADAMSLWTTHTHALAAFHLSPRLSLYSPKPGCGKTTAFDVLTTMLPRPLRTENISPAVLFRLVDQHQPALLLDEVVEAFPSVYNSITEVRDAPPDVSDRFGMFGWDKGKDLRKDLIWAFTHSDWPPGHLALAARDPVLLRKIFKRIMRQRRGDDYVSAMVQDLMHRADPPSQALLVALQKMVEDPNFLEEWD